MSFMSYRNNQELDSPLLLPIVTISFDKFDAILLCEIYKYYF